MRSYIKCSVCGFIGEDGKIQQVCPSCGAPLASFEHYEYGIGDKRLSNLTLRIHPLLVHFPQSISILSLVLIIIAFLMKADARGEMILIEKIISILLPFSIIAAMAAGMFDAKARLKDTNGPIRQQKMKFGALFLVTSGLSAILINYEFFTPLGIVLILLLNTLGVIFSVLLGIKGASLLNVLVQDAS